MILIFFLFVASIVFFVLCVLSIFNIVGVHYIPLGFGSMMTFLLGHILFFKKTNKFPKNDISEYCKFDWKKYATNVNENNIICFEKQGDVWICDNGERKVVLDLTGYPFQRAYLISYVVRNMRYKFISQKLPLKHLFKYSFPIHKRIDIKLLLIDGNRRKEITVVKKGVTKYSFIARQITLSAFYYHLFSNESYQRIRHHKTYIDEKKYKSFHKK